MARLLIIGGGCRGRRLASALVAEGNSARITTREERNRAAIEAAGAECVIATPDRIATLRPALANATILAWLLGNATGESEALAALHGTRLEFMLMQAIDTTVRGILYEASGTVDPELLRAGAERVRNHCELNAIPYGLLVAHPADADAWEREARAAVERLLGG